MKEVEVDKFQKARRVKIEKINKEHLAEKLFSSKAWMGYNLVQIAISVFIIIYVVLDIKNKYILILSNLNHY